MTAEEPVLIVDIGSSSAKIGYNGEDVPSYIFPSVINKTYPKNIESVEVDNTYGDGNYTYGNHPVNRGEIDWDKMETFWASILEKTGTASCDTAVLIVESVKSTVKDRLQWADLLFNARHPSICMFNSASLSMFASGRTTGLAVECGSGITSTVPIFEGLKLSHASISMNYGGQDISSNLRKLFSTKGITIDLPSAQVVKERLADANKITGRRVDTSFFLPDGEEVTVDRTILHNCTSDLFVNMNQDFGGLTSQAYESIALCDDSVKKVLANNIIISGGTSMLKGLGDRLQTEISTKISAEEEFGRISLPTEIVRVIPHSNYSERGYTSQRKFAAWAGGSILSSFSTFHKYLKVTKQEWEEDKMAVLNVKSF